MLLGIKVTSPFIWSAASKQLKRTQYNLPKNIDILARLMIAQKNNIIQQEGTSPLAYALFKDPSGLRIATALNEAIFDPLIDLINDANIETKTKAILFEALSPDKAKELLTSIKISQTLVVGTFLEMEPQTAARILDEESTLPALVATLMGTPKSEEEEKRVAQIIGSMRNINKTLEGLQAYPRTAGDQILSAIAKQFNEMPEEQAVALVNTTLQSEQNGQKIPIIRRFKGVLERMGVSQMSAILLKVAPEVQFALFKEMKTDTTADSVIHAWTEKTERKGEVLQLFSDKEIHPDKACQILKSIHKKNKQVAIVIFTRIAIDSQNRASELFQNIDKDLFIDCLKTYGMLTFYQPLVEKFSLTQIAEILEQLTREGRLELAIPVFTCACSSNEAVDIILSKRLSPQVRPLIMEQLNSKIASKLLYAIFEKNKDTAVDIVKYELQTDNGREKLTRWFTRTYSWLYKEKRVAPFTGFIYILKDSLEDQAKVELMQIAREADKRYREQPKNLSEFLRQHVTTEDIRKCMVMPVPLVLDDTSSIQFHPGSGAWFITRRATGKLEKLQKGDTIEIGDMELPVNLRSPIEEFILSATKGNPFGEATIAIGRYDEDDTVFPTRPKFYVPKTHHSVSRNHAELRLSGGAVFVRDLSSANGTFLRDIEDSLSQHAWSFAGTLLQDIELSLGRGYKLNIPPILDKDNLDSSRVVYVDEKPYLKVATPPCLDKSWIISYGVNPNKGLLSVSRKNYSDSSIRQSNISLTRLAEKLYDKFCTRTTGKVPYRFDVGALWERARDATNNQQELAVAIKMTLDNASEASDLIQTGSTFYIVLTDEGRKYGINMENGRISEYTYSKNQETPWDALIPV
ncbi:hypothetical protein A3J90_01425 [candidate division WOR-1 bacterium RIFOXYC2_FULL_37_10]|uniref:FHA domain-containing protein n=1 Tax=candidate division WOR-1 bacterium RIFOXYB2_FULL_37_13 TaxID=1802579 RepID=A0A1F4ST11_UNCSA|nr:MAG: hypothetical protein A2246_05970 [candidate division WOR-1 bacterium RIFOXYA2_FULL_37_7]OGC23561.1 MAG: hypothetical protein A2310_03090 [candidate division WOR-1 bacterium RIFOXYB2_FULL_37_13]OGC35772.1 MAG: hypothetical protein A3J90_01425 [candidate division WOR-1 bacterium RIFOXYC2_FULL_37_10]